MSPEQAISSGTVVVEADRRYASALVQVSHLDLVQRQHHVLTTDRAYRVDLCITPRLPSRMRFGRWPASRYERPGRLFVMPPGETLDMWNDLGRESVIVAHLFTDSMARLLEGEEGPRGDPLDASTDVASNAIEQLMLRLREEVRAPGFASEMMIEALSMQISVELQRHYRNALPPAQTGGLAPWRLRRIDERIRSLDEPASLVELAELCGLSVRQLSRGFRVSTGRSIGQHVGHLRIERAKEILAGGQSVKVVAGRMGFSSTAAFCFAFRKATGFTPAEYRRLAG